MGLKLNPTTGKLDLTSPNYWTKQAITPIANSVVPYIMYPKNVQEQCAIGNYSLSRMTVNGGYPSYTTSDSSVYYSTLTLTHNHGEASGYCADILTQGFYPSASNVRGMLNNVILPTDSTRSASAVTGNNVDISDNSPWYLSTLQGYRCTLRHANAKGFINSAVSFTGGTSIASGGMGTYTCFNSSGITGSNGPTTQYGFYTGTMGNASTSSSWGLYIANQTNSMQPYAIYSAGATNNSAIFGPTSFGFDYPCAKLDTSALVVGDRTTLGTDLVTNGTFTGSSTGWTEGTGWAYGTNNETKNADGTGTLSQTLAITAGKLYTLTFTITNWAGPIKNVSYAPTAAGSGYTVGDVLTITTGGTSGTVTVETVDGSGGVLTLSLTTAGSNYTTGTGKVTTGGTGTGCTVNILAIAVNKLTPSLGGFTGSPIVGNGTYVMNFLVTSTAALTFTPTSTSRFTIDTISVKQNTGGDAYIAGTLKATYLSGDFKGVTDVGTLGSELITTTANRDFSSDTGNWTGTNWSIGSGVATHTAGANDFTLSAAQLTPTAGLIYVVTAKLNTTTVGTIQPYIGGATDNALGQRVETITTQTWIITAVNTDPLKFTPDANWAGYIDNVSVKVLTPGATAVYNVYNSDATLSAGLLAGGTGLKNTIYGYNSGKWLVSAVNNTVYGYGAGECISTGGNNTYLGYMCGNKSGAGTNNVAVGYTALANNTGSYNLAIGSYTLPACTTGKDNTGFGNSALRGLTTGIRNVGAGYQALRYGTTENYVTSMGFAAGAYSNADNGIFIGANAGYRHSTESYKLCIDSRQTALANSTLEASYSIIYGTMAATPDLQTLDINATTTLSYGLIQNVTTVTDTYTILSTDYTVVCNKSTDFTVTLPTAVVGQIFNVKNINTGVVTLEGAGSDTIDGEANQTIDQWENLQIQCSAANTWIIL